MLMGVQPPGTLALRASQTEWSLSARGSLHHIAVLRNMEERILHYSMFHMLKQTAKEGVSLL